jgi:coatomer subunit alpha
VGACGHASQDKSIRVWDMTKRAGVQTYRREHDRYWVLAAHPDQNLFAAGTAPVRPSAAPAVLMRRWIGHDSGLIVYKLERERPPSAVNGDVLFYVKDKYLRTLDLPSGRDVPLLNVRRAVGARTLAYNPAEHAVLITSKADGGTYDLFSLPREAPKEISDNPESKRGLGMAACFVARNRFAVLDKGGLVYVRNLANELTKTLKVPTSVDNIFYAGTGLLLLRTEESVALLDIQRKEVCVGRALTMPRPGSVQLTAAGGVW